MYRKIKNLTYVYLLVLSVYICIVFYIDNYNSNYLTLKEISIPLFSGVIIMVIVSIIFYSNLFFKLGFSFGIIGCAFIICIIIIELNGYSALETLDVDYITSETLTSEIPTLNVPIFKLDMILLYSQIIPYCCFLFINFFYISFIVSNKKKDEEIIKSVIDDFSQKYSRIEIREISEKCNKNPTIIKKIVKDMVDKREINAKYFPNTKVIVFSKIASENYQKI